MLCRWPRIHLVLESQKQGQIRQNTWQKEVGETQHIITTSSIYPGGILLGYTYWLHDACQHEALSSWGQPRITKAYTYIVNVSKYLNFHVLNHLRRPKDFITFLILYWHWDGAHCWKPCRSSVHIWWKSRRTSEKYVRTKTTSLCNHVWHS